VDQHSTRTGTAPRPAPAAVPVRPAGPVAAAVRRLRTLPGGSSGSTGGMEGSGVAGGADSTGVTSGTQAWTAGTTRTSRPAGTGRTGTPRTDGTVGSAAPTRAQTPRATGTTRAARTRTRTARLRPRLTGLGTAALVTVVTVLAGLLDSLLFHGPGTFFGVVFVLVCAAAAVYVRPYDLVAAPVAAPIAFALGIVLTADGGSGGLVGHLVAVFTGLALMTGWLYTGTVLAAVIVGVRALRQPSRRRRSRRCSAAPRGRSPR